MFHLVTRLQHHYTGDKRHVLPPDSPSGHEQFERSCERCGTVRITVIGVPAEEARQWRTPGGHQYLAAEFAAPCVPAKPVVLAEEGT